MNKTTKSPVNKAIAIARPIIDIDKMDIATLEKMVVSYEQIQTILANPVYQTNNLTLDSFATTIAKYCLKKLWSKGNENAYHLFIGENRTINLEDLKQDVVVYLLENTDFWEITNNKFICDNQEFFSSIFGVVSNRLYKELQRHYKHSYIEIDGDIVDLNNIKQLSMHVDYSLILANEDYNKYLTYISKEYKKHYNDMKTLLDYRLNGYSMKECENITKIKHDRWTYVNRLLQKSWKEFNK